MLEANEESEFVAAVAVKRQQLQNARKHLGAVLRFLYVYLTIHFESPFDRLENASSFFH